MRTAIALIVCFVLISPLANGQVKSQKAVTSGLPKSIRYQGKLKQAIQFQDNTGTYLALTAETGEQPQKGDDQFKQAHLYSYLYQVNGNGQSVLKWQLQDMVTDCDLDIKAEFVPRSLTITDLDKNGKAEVWVAYRLACNGDISPSEYKVVMREQNIKYAKQGIGKIKIGNSIQPDGGEITSNTFKKAAAVFKQYADQLWNKYLLEIN
jgi:hypothetical protein